MPSAFCYSCCLHFAAMFGQGFRANLEIPTMQWPRRTRLSEQSLCAGLYLLLAAGTTVIPERLRLTRYKLWMRIVLTAWWVVILLGVATYARWYIPNLFRR